LKHLFLSNFSYNINWPNQNEYVCKIRLYLLNVSWMVSVWSIVGASIDRYLCSSALVRYRQWSTVRTARCAMAALFISAATVYLEVLYCFEANVPNVPVACYCRNLACRLFNDWMNLLGSIVIPSVLLVVFGTLTLRNARVRRVQPILASVSTVTTIRNGTRTQQNDRNLTRMLSIQVSLALDS